MFHRVSPQAEQDQKEISEKNSQNAPEETGAVEEQKQPVEAQNAEQENTQTENTTQTKKDTQDMNETAKNQPAEAPTEAQAQTSSFERTAGAYQRPGQAPAQASQYASSYASTSSYGSASSEAPASAGDRTLTIGRGITMSGEIEACDYLLVEGTVEAALKGANVLEISETGTFYGTVEIDEATISGRFEGDITVNGRLTIRTGGVITGSIAYGELEVEAGATIDGRLTPVAAQPAQAAQPAAPKSKPAAEALQKAKEQDPAPANTDGELFSSKTAS